MNNMLGNFVVLEGMDGVGTTTQTRKLVAYLRSLGLSVTESAEPTTSVIGQEIRRILKMPIDGEKNLLACLALCFAADRMQHIHQTVMPAMLKQDFIVLDRYVMSSLVYQGLHLPSTFVKEINRFALSADLTIVLDMDPKRAHERLAQRNGPLDFYESFEFLSQLRGRYLHFAKEEPSSTVIIDGDGSMEDVHSHVVHVIRERFKL
jgi:dTMP kinase